MDIVGQVGIGKIKRSEVCWVYGRELVVLNGKNERNRQKRVKKKDKNVGIRKSSEEEKKRVEWRLRCEIRKRRCEIWNKVIRDLEWR